MAYSDKFSLTAWSLDGKKRSGIGGLVSELTWSGSYTDCARKLAYSALPETLSELGGAVELAVGAEPVFSGRVFVRRRDSLSQTFSCTAYDRGIYLKRNETSIAVRGQTPEAVAGRLCAEFGIQAGELAATGVQLNRNFFGVDLYRIVQTLYSLAAERNGKKYQVRFRGVKLDVVEKTLGPETLRLLPGSNLLSCSASESMEKLVTSVAVYDGQYKKIASYDSQEGFRELYGLMQQVLRASDKEDPAKSAKQILEDNGIRTTITARCLGNRKLISGNAAVVHEPVTGTDGLFWILSDSHTWTRGVYRTTVTLDFRNLMDEQEAGSVPTS